MVSVAKTISEMMNGMDIPQLILLAVFIVYFVFPITFPSSVYRAFESIPGMIFVFCAIVYLFLYSHPVLGIFALLAAYEFFYHSSQSYSPSTPKTAFLEYNHQPLQQEEIQQEEILQEIEFVQPPSLPITVPSASMTLEEEMVQEMAPIGYSDTSTYINTRFQPVAHSVGSASIY
jgi:hypothetical protein